METTGTRKKFPIAPRKRCSSTLPESSTWLTHEPPLRFVANWAASSFEGTPLSSNKLIRDWLGAEFIQENSRHVQRAPHGIGKRAGDAHGIILLHPRDRIGHLCGKHAVNRAAIITQPAQSCLHRADITRIQNELFWGFEVVNPSPMISRSEICGVHTGSLMHRSPFVSLSQRIGRTKNIMRQNVELVSLRDDRAEAEN